MDNLEEYVRICEEYGDHDNIPMRTRVGRVEDGFKDIDSYDPAYWDREGNLKKSFKRFCGPSAKTGSGKWGERNKHNMRVHAHVRGARRATYDRKHGEFISAEDPYSSIDLCEKNNCVAIGEIVSDEQER